MPIISELPIEKIQREKRRTISIKITEQGKIIIKAPFYITDKDIEKVLIHHSQWLEDRLKKMEEKNKWVQKKIVNGEKFLYLGKLYELQLTNNQKDPLIFNNEIFFLDKQYKNQAIKLFKQWYRLKAKENFYKRARIYAPLLGVNFKQIKLSNAQKRWGSCSSMGYINIVWRLIMAPQSIIDYVIVHELAHRRYMNHSKSFWHLVESVYPEHKQARQWLRNYGHYLNI